MQLDCLTAGSPPSQRSLINTLCQIVSLLAPHSFPLSLNMVFPCMCPSVLCVLHCALPLFLLPPVSSSHGRCVSVACCRSRSYALQVKRVTVTLGPGRRVHQAKMHRRIFFKIRHLPPILWRAPDLPATFVSIKFPLEKNDLERQHYGILGKRWLFS